ncbi:helix-hairpin-helix domain-containing protein [Chitinophaga pinensis]|uniref:DNA uptake protein and related DNA-binding protein n=1 Tax=Chitinophaga pinensis (strain ATCC 43595 / DSM 2588 / LMG 13176 / NBRC 15968 / NCIMB 11800 / UQM 2034) TaxID=485918 RepID=A0A979G0U9_CHIPD|nr:helix-hairpin-helix domain-containing protein [Chitinophaga pinensis]ACU58785.1 DNA uptake protein and related DNA-binding protein [Chitinophaga pinensis DSM 2588]
MKQALWKAYCSFSVKERQGILLLLLVTVVCAATPALWEYCMPPAALKTDSTLLAEVRAFRSSLSATAVKGSDDVKHHQRFYFDPNTIDAEGWSALGLPERTIRMIARYRDKGGQFRRKEDLLRIYGLSPVLACELLPYVRISAPVAKKDTGYPSGTAFAARQPYKVGKRIPQLDINTADSMQWEALPGIGPVLAARIVKFRDRLGGFYTVAQIGETFGLPDSTFNKIQPYLRLSTVSLKKLDLNQTDEKSLAQHPYIRYKLARLIILYRSNHGAFRRLDDLLGIPLVDDSIYRKIEHYIKTENSPL